jgi:hypothetical protein
MRTSLIVLTAMLAATSANAYVCARVTSDGNDDGASLSWFQRDLSFNLFGGGTADIAGDEEFAVLRDSFAVWTSLHLGTGETAESCGLTTSIDISFTEGPPATVDRVGYDFLAPENTQNILIFRDSGWDSADSSVIALTTTTYDPVSGEILDADIEFNSSSFDFATDGDPSSMDLQNTTVHEIGHFLGLAHTQSAHSDATMYARAVPGETQKRDLACDDAQAITFKYPAGEPNGYCNGDPACASCAPPDTETSSTRVLVTKSSSTGHLDHGGCQATDTPAWLSAIAILCCARRRRNSCDTPETSR